MKTGIHDNIIKLQKLLVQPTLQLAMPCSPPLTVYRQALGGGYTKPMHIMLGNNDGDMSAIIHNTRDFVNLPGPFTLFQMKGRPVSNPVQDSVLSK